MRYRDTLPGMVAVLGLLLTTSAAASGLPGQARLRGTLGFTTLGLADLNGRIRAERDAFMADTLTDEARWDPLGGAPAVGFEVDVRLSPRLTAGLGFSAHHSAVRHEAFQVLSVDPGTGEPAEVDEFDESLRLSAWDVVGTVGVWVPSAPGLHFGGQLGMVRGKLESERVRIFSTFSSGEFTRTDRGEWTGTGLVLGAFTGYDQSVTSTLSLSSRLGYRYRKISAPEGVVRTLVLDENEGTSYEWEAGPLVDSTGRRMSLDLGGFYFNMMLSLGFGGGE